MYGLEEAAYWPMSNCKQILNIVCYSHTPRMWSKHIYYHIHLNSL